MIYVMSGGTTKGFAAIGVIYPADVACTCSNGTKTLTAKGTNGRWVFPIPEEGKWIVVAGDKLKEVSIEHPGQCELVNLSEYVIFNGSETAAYTGGWTDNFTVGSTLDISNSNSSATYVDYRNGSSKAAIDLTNISKLEITVSSIFVSNYIKFFADDESHNDYGIYNNIADMVLASVDLSKGTVSFDVSSLTGSYYLGIAMSSKPSGSSNVKISKIVGVMA